MENLNYCENRIFLCVDCYNCKIKNSKVYCKEGYFKELNIKDISLFTPFEFDCCEFEIE